MREGDVFLLCSDGLSGVVKDPEITRILAPGGDLMELCKTLITTANENGGPDNITAILVRVEA
jgi:protein phosphatase